MNIIDKYFTPALASHFCKMFGFSVPMTRDKELLFKWMELYDGSRSKFVPADSIVGRWNFFQECLELFDGDESAFLNEYRRIKEHVMKYIKGLPAYNEFNTCDINARFPLLKTDTPKKNVYTIENENGIFRSIDIKEANFQALKFAGVISGTYDNWKDFFMDVCEGISSEKMLMYVAASKYARQVIFGQLNPKRTIHVESFMISKVIETISEKYPMLKLVQMNSDEVIYRSPVGEDLFKAQVYSVYDTLNRELPFKTRHTCFNMRAVNVVQDNEVKHAFFDVHVQEVVGPKSYDIDTYDKFKGVPSFFNPAAWYIRTIQNNFNNMTDGRFYCNKYFSDFMMFPEYVRTAEINGMKCVMNHFCLVYPSV